MQKVGLALAGIALFFEVAGALLFLEGHVEASAPPAPAPAPPSAPDPAPPAPPPPPSYANEDPDDDLIVAPPDVRPGCEDERRAGGVKFTAAKLPLQKHKFYTCGAEQVVVYQRGPAGISYEPAPLVTCTLALALSRFDTIAQEEAARTLGKRITRAHHLGTFACREMAAYPGWVSEHSYANAIDMQEWVLENGKTVSVVKHFDRTESPAKPEGRFLRALSRRAFDEGTFSAVLTPFFDSLHHNHFHLDLGRFRTDGTRPHEG